MYIQKIVINNFVIVFHICKKNLCKEQTFLLVHNTVYAFQMVVTAKIWTVLHFCSIRNWATVSHLRVFHFRPCTGNSRNKL